MSMKKDGQTEEDLTPREIAFVSGHGDTRKERVERIASTVLSIGDEDRRVGEIRTVKSRRR